MFAMRIVVAVQTSSSWHDGGMFGGMHWGWWSVWLATLLILCWAFFRLFTDRSQARRGQRLREAAEKDLRGRFDRREIDEAEFEDQMATLRQMRFGD